MDADRGLVVCLSRHSILRLTTRSSAAAQCAAASFLQARLRWSSAHDVRVRTPLCATSSRQALLSPDTAPSPAPHPPHTMNTDMDVRRANAKELKAGYSSSKRAVEVGFTVAGGVMWAYNLMRIGAVWQTIEEDVALTCVCAVLIGALVSDFMSGLVHWGADTWGSVNTPVFGTFIRSFREHHVDAQAMCHHDFVQTNGDNVMLTVPTLFWMALSTIDTSRTAVGDWFVPHTFTWQVYCLSLTLYVGLTNQFHKSSHEIKPHPVMKTLMDCNLVLTRANHSVHHMGEHDTSYCITLGWLNPALDAIDFWRKAEWAVTATTGYIPRENDGELMGKKGH